MVFGVWCFRSCMYVMIHTCCVYRLACASKFKFRICLYASSAMKWTTSRFVSHGSVRWCAETHTDTHKRGRILFVAVATKKQSCYRRKIASGYCCTATTFACVSSTRCRRGAAFTTAVLKITRAAACIFVHTAAATEAERLAVQVGALMYHTAV